MSQFSNPAGRAPEAAGAYVRSVIALVADRDPIEVLVELPGWLEARTAGLDDAKRRRPEAPGKWSVHDVVQHLVDAETAFLWRTRLICAEEGEPVLQGYDQDHWAAVNADAPADEALAVYSTLRAWNVRFLRGLNAEAFSKSVNHPERGAIYDALFDDFFAHLGGME